jgi:hypothetical protein
MIFIVVFQIKLPAGLAGVDKVESKVEDLAGMSGAVAVTETAAEGEVTTAAPLLALFTSQGLGGEGILILLL